MTGCAPRPPFDRRARAAFVVAIVTLLASGIGFRSAVAYLNVYLSKDPVPLREHLVSIPRTLGPWVTVGEDIRLDDAEVEALGTDRYLNRTFRLEDDPEVEINLHIAYYTGMIDAVPHVPDRCFVAGGWDPRSAPENLALPVAYPDARVDRDYVNRQTGEAYRIVRVRHPITGRRETQRLPQGDFELRTITFTRDSAPDYVLWGGYMFIANHRLTASPATIRSLAFRPDEKSAYYCKVQVATMLRRDQSSERFVDLASDLIGRAVPHLMRCLPDWAEVDPEPGGGSRPAADSRD